MPDNTCICCGRVIPEVRQICLRCGSYDDMQTFRPSSRAYYPEPPKVTNGDRIRAMSNEELARFIYLQQMYQQLTGTVEAVETILKALESEVPHE